jgi:hypothetical protein
MQQLTTFEPFHTIEPCIWLFVDSTEIGLIVTASPHPRNVIEPRAGKILNFKIGRKVEISTETPPQISASHPPLLSR